MGQVAATDPGAANQDPDRTRPAYVAVLGTAVLCYAALGAVLRALPWLVSARLGGGPVAIGLSVGAPALTGAVLRPLGGRLADRVGPLPVLLSGAGLMALGVLPALDAHLVALVASRLVVGGGEALMMSAAVLWLLKLAGSRRRGRALGHIGLANYAGLTLGPLFTDAIDPAAHLDLLWALALALPLVGGVLALTQRRTQGTPEERPVPQAASPRDEAASLGSLTLRPGLGLLLVNVGYVALLSFGAAATTAHHLHIEAFVVPVFGLGVILSRTLLASVPDRLGGARTLTGGAGLAAAGLVVVATAHGAWLGILGVLTLAVGQGVAVPALGLLALARVDPSRQGAAAGLFFAYFDAGVGLGGPLVGLAARAFNAPAALLVAAGTVGAAVPAALLSLPVAATRRRV